MIFHAEKRSGFVMMDKAGLNDKRLSLKAKGLLAYLLSKPPDWSPQVTEVSEHCNDGRESIESAFRELQKFGYAKLLKVRGAGGQFGGQGWSIFETPETITEKPRNREPVSPATNNNDSTKNKALTKQGDFDELRLPIPPSCTVEQARKEAKDFLESHLQNLKGGRLWAIWTKRAELCPMRTIMAIGRLDEDLAAVACAAREGRKWRGPIPSVRNRGAKANWYFLNVNLENGRVCCGR